MFTCKTADLPKIVETLKETYEVYEVNERGAKPYFFPQVEDLMKFKTEGKNIELFDIRAEIGDFVLCGVHACDMQALKVLDNVFLADPVDTYYENRRNHGIIITRACNAPKNTCFCGTFGIDASNPGGDIASFEAGEDLFFEVNTEKGQAVADKLVEAGIFTETEDTAKLDAQKEEIQKKLAALPLADVKADRFGAGKTQEFFNRPEWAQLSESCLGCGTCTFVCPTCQCYDIKDFDTGNGVIRFRSWDSCMYSLFTQMSAGQPRLSQLERFRQRFMHKLVYYPENNDGLFSCVGCGRCLEKCPIQMNIVKVMKKLGEDEK